MYSAPCVFASTKITPFNLSLEPETRRQDGLREPGLREAAADEGGHGHLLLDHERLPRRSHRRRLRARPPLRGHHPAW